MRADKRDLQRPVAFRHFRIERVRRRVVRHRCRHDHRIGPSGVRAHRLRHFSGASDAFDEGAGRSIELRGPGHEHDVRAAPCALRRDRISHAPAGSIADEADRIEIFERRPG